MLLRIAVLFSFLACLLTAQGAAAAPKDAVALFDGSSGDAWMQVRGDKPCAWDVTDGELRVHPGAGNLITRAAFNDFRLHLEFWLPRAPDDAAWQARSNSGVYLQGLYEIQVLDSYGRELRPSNCGGLYGQKAADRNAARPAEQWQSYDITFRAPRFDAQGQRTEKARVTVLWNGVRVHDDVAIDGPTTAHMKRDPRKPGPILLQDHGHPVRYRNVSIQELGRAGAGEPPRLPKLFADHMVLQRGRPIPVWGQATASETIVVSYAGQRVEGKAGKNGRWRVDLPSLETGGPSRLTVQGERGRRDFEDVCVGEVWLASGQSNMQWTVKNSADAEAEIARGDHPGIRLCTVKRRRSAEPQRDAEITWARCKPETVAGFSAVAYYFGRHLHEKLNVPVGLIHSSWGGTPVEAWTDPAALQADPELVAVFERWDRLHQDAARRHRAALEKWRDAAGEAVASGTDAPKKPRLRAPPAKNAPGVLYDGMIAPLVPYGLRGVIWYQGERNAPRAHQYRTLFPALIEDWRRHWKAELPFLFVQLANWRARKDTPSQSDWAELREAQAMTLSLPLTGMAVAIDIGDPKNIHPKNKQEVGRRLALLARRDVYGEKDVAAAGPMLDDAVTEANRIRLTFRETAGGLKTSDGAPLTGFAIAGKDQKFHWAEATIQGNSVLVSSDAVPAPTAVRYAWADNPACNLTNTANLPAPPFRTDTWPALTTGKN